MFFFFNDTATTEIYTLSLHDALPISRGTRSSSARTTWAATSCPARSASRPRGTHSSDAERAGRSEEHTSELQSRPHLVCRLLLEKKKQNARQATPDARHSAAPDRVSH